MLFKTEGRSPSPVDQTSKRRDLITLTILRLNDKDIEKFDELSKFERKDRSAAARELRKYGWEFLRLKHYKEGAFSLEGLARKLDLSTSEPRGVVLKRGVLKAARPVPSGGL